MNASGLFKMYSQNRTTDSPRLIFTAESAEHAEKDKGKIFAIFANSAVKKLTGSIGGST
jgi:hypothetical protein